MYREDDASRRAMDALRRLVSGLRTSGAAASGELGISVAQLFALRVIGNRSGISMGELGERTLTSPSAISEVVTRLVDNGFVHRNHAPDDGRRIILSLTPRGEVLMRQIGETLPERLIAALVAMPPPARETLADMLENWVREAGLANTKVRMFGEGERVDELRSAKS